MAWDSIGIPSVPKLPSNIGNALISFGGAQLINRVFNDYWGIFNQRGIPILLADNVVTFNHESKSQVSSSPVEQGSFSSYNKVAEPFQISVMMSKASGGVFQRGAFIAQIDALKNSTDLFMVITPEAVYSNCAITSYDYAREAGDGARMIKVNIHLQEVREVVVEYKKTKVESAAPEQDGGKVQATANKTANAPEQVSMARWIKDNGANLVAKVFER